MTSQFKVLNPVMAYILTPYSSLLGFSLGRPFRIHVEDVTVGKPVDHVNQFGQNAWLPYVLPSPLDTSYSQIDYTEAVSYQHITLCEIMSSCGYIL